jgi:hypothetical protein
MLVIAGFNRSSRLGVDNAPEHTLAGGQAKYLRVSLTGGCIFSLI